MKRIALTVAVAMLLAVSASADERPRIDGVVKVFHGCSQPVEQRTTYEVARIVDLNSQAKFQALIEVAIAFNTYARQVMADHPGDPILGCVGVLTEAK